MSDAEPMDRTLTLPWHAKRSSGVRLVCHSQYELYHCLSPLAVPGWSLVPVKKQAGPTKQPLILLLAPHLPWTLCLPALAAMWHIVILLLWAELKTVADPHDTDLALCRRASMESSRS